MTRIFLSKGLVPQFFELSLQYLRWSEKPKTKTTNGVLYLFYLQTAAEYVKSRLPEALKQHLQDYEKDKENSVLSYQTILEQQILSIDREMLEKLTVSYDEAGMFVFNAHTFAQFFVLAGLYRHWLNKGKLDPKLYSMD